jgi:hypothetical protein
LLSFLAISSNYIPQLRDVVGADCQETQQR